MVFFDATHRQELEEATAYELWALEFLRERLFRQSEGPNAHTTFRLGDVAENGELLQHVSLSFVSRLSEGAVAEALDHFRPLAFGAAFKLQDMIAEWILRANGETGWTFAAKINAYNTRTASGTLTQPPLFGAKPQVARAFWELFRKLTPFRNGLTHKGQVVPDAADHSLTLVTSNGASLVLTDAQQAVYVRACCLLTQLLLEASDTPSYVLRLVEHALAALEPLHGVTGFVARSVRLEAARLEVPLGQVAPREDGTYAINLGPMWQGMRTTHPVGEGGELFIALTIVIETEGGHLAWALPPEMVPQGELQLRVGDPRFEPFRVPDGAPSPP